MKNSNYLFLLTIFIYQIGFSQNSLRVGDPQRWGTYVGNIDEAILSIKPKGMYNEYGLYLTFSSKGTHLTSVNDTLEVVLNFRFPEKAIIHDSWLYMKDWISKGKILDKWTATQIYEDIVDRRKDPSILSKISNTDYQLRVFPMAGNETRKVKISYLLPADWSSKTISSQLPIDLLRTSRNNINQLNLITWSSNDFGTPSLSDSSLEFKQKNDSNFGDYYYVGIPYNSLNSDLKINFKTPNKNLFLTKFKNNDNSEFYQLSLSTEAFLDNKEEKKVLVLIDYDQNNARMTTDEILKNTEREVLNNLNPKDSFNLMVSSLSIKKYSDKWEVASKENIKSSFSQLKNSLTTYSNFSNLLVTGIEFINEFDSDAEILLISNSDEFFIENIANSVVNDLVALAKKNSKIHIVDYQDTNFSDYRINGRWYTGNEYLYSNLSKITLGSLSKVYENRRYSKPFSSAVSEAFKHMSGTINSLDVHTTLADGFCYNRFYLSNSEDINFVTKPIQQTGRLKGNFPFIVNVTGEYNGSVFSKKISVDEDDIIQGDSITEKIWAGQYIQNLENVSQSNSIIDDIITSSKEFSLLSMYTSFLCLEEKEEYACFDCLDESVLSLETQRAQDGAFKFFPNPFTEILNIEINLKTNEKIKYLKIVDLNGKTVHSFDTSKIVAGKNNIIYKPNHLLSKGIYLINYVTNKASYKIKLVKQ